MNRLTTRSIRVAAVAAVATVAAASLAACGAGDKANSGQKVACDFPKQNNVTVNVLAYSASATDPFTNAMVRSCSRNGVTVKHAPIDFSGQYTKTATTLAGSTGTYDIIEMYSAAIPGYSTKLVPLNSLIAKYKSKYKLGDLDPTFVKGMSYKGQIYGLPTQANVGTMVYRKDIFDSLKLSAPKTYADVLADAQKIKASGKMAYPVALPYGDNTSTLYEQMMNSQGVHNVYTDASGQVNWTSSQSTKALSALRALAPYTDPQVISFDQPRVQQQLYNGKAAIAIMFSGRMADLVNKTNTKYYDKFAFAPVPSIDPGGASGAAISVDGWSIPKNSKISPDLLFQLIAASVSEAASKSAIPAAYPARKGIATPKTVPYAQAVIDALKNGAAPPAPYTWLGSVENDVTAYIQQAATGKTSIAAAQAKAQAATAKDIKKTNGK